MPVFPPDLKFPSAIKKPISCGPTTPLPPFDFLVDIDCDGHRFKCIVNNPPVLENCIYYFYGVHMIIPEFFSKVDVDHETGEILNETNPPLDFEFNQLFALNMRGPHPDFPSDLWNGFVTMDDGCHNCAVPAHNLIRNKDGKVVSNIHQLFFKFHNHYYTPIILSNGIVVYYVFEAASTIKKLVKMFRIEEDYIIAVNAPIEFSNTLRVPITRIIRPMVLSERKPCGDFESLLPTDKK